MKYFEINFELNLLRRKAQEQIERVVIEQAPLEEGVPMIMGYMKDRKILNFR